MSSIPASRVWSEEKLKEFSRVREIVSKASQVQRASLASYGRAGSLNREQEGNFEVTRLVTQKLPGGRQDTRLQQRLSCELLEYDKMDPSEIVITQISDNDDNAAEIEGAKDEKDQSFDNPIPSFDFDSPRVVSFSTLMKGGARFRKSKSVAIASNFQANNQNHPLYESVCEKKPGKSNLRTPQTTIQDPKKASFAAHEDLKVVEFDIDSDGMFPTFSPSAKVSVVRPRLNQRNKKSFDIGSAYRRLRRSRKRRSEGDVKKNWNTSNSLNKTTSFMRAHNHSSEFYSSFGTSYKASHIFKSVAESVNYTRYSICESTFKLPPTYEFTKPTFKEGEEISKANKGESANFNFKQLFKEEGLAEDRNEALDTQYTSSDQNQVVTTTAETDRVTCPHCKANNAAMLHLQRKTRFICPGVIRHLPCLEFLSIFSRRHRREQPIARYKCKSCKKLLPFDMVPEVRSDVSDHIKIEDDQSIDVYSSSSSCPTE